MRLVIRVLIQSVLRGLGRVVSGGLNNSGELFTTKAARADLSFEAGLAALAAAARTTLALRAEPSLFELRGRTMTQGAVAATGVVEGFDVIEDHQFGSGFCRCDGVGEAFGFQRSDEAFGQGLVVGIGFTAHAGSDVPKIKAVLKSLSSILAAPVAVVD